MAEADQRHAARLPHGIAGTVVGKADKDGNPTSFDPHAPPVVHVDPDEPDGGVIIDMSKVTREDMERAAASSGGTTRSWKGAGAGASAPSCLAAVGEPCRSTYSRA